ncbi:hypothetical protein DPMN_172091 [Dreissena polymorpha]|uniref:Uncharacterized protein n=1 Tax=Dreissena polymorpha TaxID=45954 RepID=A0A9D4E0C7_DREPO|nr:hypothetical protein DPMN_172091 [Dreissena polymorpha]
MAEFQRLLKNLPLCPKSPDRCNASETFMSINGTCNNLKNPTWGMSAAVERRLLPAAYSDRILHGGPESSGLDSTRTEGLSYALSALQSQKTDRYRLEALLITLLRQLLFFKLLPRLSASITSSRHATVAAAVTEDATVAAAVTEDATVAAAVTEDATTSQKTPQSKQPSQKTPQSQQTSQKTPQSQQLSQKTQTMT